MSGYKMKRDLINDGERLDTIDQGDDDEDDEPPADYNDDSEDVDSDDGKAKRAAAERIEVNLDDINDDDDSESLLGQQDKIRDLFAIKESHDRGLADMETGSEVYMSELLVR
jgi:hypothetical protein